MCPWRNRITTEDRKHSAADSREEQVERAAQSRRGFCLGSGALALAAAADGTDSPGTVESALLERLEHSG